MLQKKPYLFLQKKLQYRRLVSIPTAEHINTVKVSYKVSYKVSFYKLQVFTAKFRTACFKYLQYFHFTFSCIYNYFCDTTYNNVPVVFTTSSGKSISV